MKLFLAAILLTATLSACTPGTYTVDVVTRTHTTVIEKPKRELHPREERVYPNWPYCINYYNYRTITVYEARAHGVYIEDNVRWCIPPH
jgi:hypothetical protein